MAWLDLMLKGLKDIQTAFEAYIIDASRRATYTGQVIVLERMLNFIYYGIDNTYASSGDNTAGGHIYIEKLGGVLPYNYTWYDAEGQVPYYLYYDSEGKPPKYFFYQSEYYAQSAFTVRVPLALVSGLTAPELTAFHSGMRAKINKYIIAGLNYNIDTY